MSKHIVSKSIREEVRNRAENEFEDFVATKETDYLWRFGNPDGSNNYSFYLVATPHVTVMYGDIGECIFNLPMNRLANHFLKHVDATHIASKVPDDIKITEFQEELVEEFCQTLLNEAEDFERGAIDAEGEVDTQALANASANRALVDHIRQEQNHDPFWSKDDFYSRVFISPDFEEEAAAFFEARNPDGSRKHDIPWSDDPPEVEGLSFWFLLRLEALKRFFAAAEKVRDELKAVTHE